MLVDFIIEKVMRLGKSNWVSWILHRGNVYLNKK